MSDTPETDHIEDQLGSAAKFSHPIIWRHARQLERERDEARIDAQKSKAYKRVLKETNLRQTERIRYLEGATNHASGTPLSTALKERDEAREALDCLLAVIGLTPIAGNKKALQEVVDQGLVVLRKLKDTK
jgi:hypothetical protein